MLSRNVASRANTEAGSVAGSSGPSIRSGETLRVLGGCIVGRSVFSGPRAVALTTRNGFTSETCSFFSFDTAFVDLVRCKVRVSG